MPEVRGLGREGLNFVTALLMDLVTGDDIEVISSFLGPTPSLRRWGWALFFCLGSWLGGVGIRTGNRLTRPREASGIWERRSR